MHTFKIQLQEIDKYIRVSMSNIVYSQNWPPWHGKFKDVTHCDTENLLIDASYSETISLPEQYSLAPG